MICVCLKNSHKNSPFLLSKGTSFYVIFAYKEYIL